MALTALVSSSSNMKAFASKPSTLTFVDTASMQRIGGGDGGGGEGGGEGDAGGGGEGGGGEGGGEGDGGGAGDAGGGEGGGGDGGGAGGDAGGGGEGGGGEGDGGGGGRRRGDDARQVWRRRRGRRRRGRRRRRSRRIYRVEGEPFVVDGAECVTGGRADVAGRGLDGIANCFSVDVLCNDDHTVSYDFCCLRGTVGVAVGITAVGMRLL